MRVLALAGLLIGASACTPITNYSEFHSRPDAGPVDAGANDAGRCGDLPEPQGSCTEAVFRCVAECAKDEPCEQACLEGEDACRTCLTTENLRCASSRGCLTTTESVLCCYEAECEGETFCDACISETQEWLLCFEQLGTLCETAGLTCFPDGLEYCDGVDNDSDDAVDEGAFCPTTQSCIAGSCVAECVEPAADCDGDGSCETTTRDNPRACGSCDRWCGSQLCAGDQCFGEQLDVGPTHACTIVFDSLAPPSSRLICWGDPTRFGQPSGSRVAQNIPLPPETGIPTAVGVGGFGTCVRGSTGALVCALDGLPFSVVSTPSESIRFIDVHIGRAHACFMGDDTSVWCVGDNTFGQRGDADIDDEFQLAITSGALEIHGGDDHTCVRASDGSIACWGRNDQLQLGNRPPDECGMAPTGERWCRPGYVPASSETILLGGRAIFGGQDFSCVPTSSSTFGCWGNVPADEFGGRTNAGLALDTEILLDLAATEVVSIASGSAFACARLRDTSVRCYGRSGTPADVAELGIAHIIAAEANTLCSYRATADLPRITCVGQDLITPMGSTDPRDIVLPGPPVD